MIRASYTEMKSQSTKIKNAANDYKSNVDSLYEIVDNLSANWKGTDNISYANTVNGYKNDLKLLGDIVNNYADFLSNGADIIRAAQDEISSSAGRL